MVIREDILNILHVKKHYSVVSRRIASYLSKKISVWGFFQLACASSPWVIHEKKQTGRGWGGVGGREGGVEDVEFPGALKKENAEIPGVN